jgi:hypothetical protein
LSITFRRQPRALCSTVSGTEFFDAPAERHILGAQVPKSPDSYLTSKSGVLLKREEKRADSSAIGGRMNNDDPIIAAIEAHRRAWLQTRTAFEHQNAVENELVAGIRAPAGEAENDPQWIAADAAVREALDMQDDLAVKLLEIQPTTTAGAAALLTYYADVLATTQPGVVFPEPDGNGWPFGSKSIDEPRRDFRYYIVRNVAAALGNIALEPEAIEQDGLNELSTGRVLVDAAE